MWDSAISINEAGDSVDCGLNEASMLTWLVFKFRFDVIQNDGTLNVAINISVELGRAADNFAKCKC